MAKKKNTRRNLAPSAEGKDEQVARALMILSEHYGAAVVIVPAMGEDGQQGFEVMSSGDRVMSLGLVSAFKSTA